jgi:hypothetical protein
MVVVMILIRRMTVMMIVDYYGCWLLWLLVNSCLRMDCCLRIDRCLRIIGGRIRERCCRWVGGRHRVTRRDLGIVLHFLFYKRGLNSFPE